MTKAALKNFRAVLTARRDELAQMLRSREAAAIERVADSLDQVVQASDRELSLGTLTRESNFLAETRAALQRLDFGLFGVCIDCEEDIGPKRLAAVPWTPRCIRCQENAEREPNEKSSEDIDLNAAAA